MNAENSTAIAILRILIVLALIGAAVFLAFRIPKLIFKNPVAAGQASCAKDKNYYYKDPQNYPYGC